MPLSRNFYVTNMSFKAILENKILANISQFTVARVSCINKYYSPHSVDLPFHLQPVLAVRSCFLALCGFLELWNWNLAVKVPLL